MALIADGLLVLAAVVAASYCIVLSRRLSRLTRHEDGLGGLIASFSLQVEEMKVALDAAKRASDGAAGDLERAIAEAEAASTRLNAAAASADRFTRSITAAEDDRRRRAPTSGGPTSGALRSGASTSWASSAGATPPAAEAESGGPKGDDDGGFAAKRIAEPSAEPDAGPSAEPSVERPAPAAGAANAGPDASVAGEGLPSSPRTSAEGHAAFELAASDPDIFESAAIEMSGASRVKAVAAAVEKATSGREAEDDDVFAERLIAALAAIEPAAGAQAPT